MLPIHTILHPTDFSDHSGVAFRLACALARDYSARLVVLHVSSPPVLIYGEGVIPPQPVDYQDRLEEELHQLQAPDPTIRTDHKMREGDPVDEILAVAEQARADLIVMGTHGRTGLGRLLMGSVAEKVVRRAACPVLTVRSPFPVAEAAHEHLAEPAVV
jgi:nucleotide-binding universal stress UspA family protein